MKKYFLSLLLLGATSLLNAQLSHYECGFEDDAENAQWHLNEPRNTAYSFSNLWYIGNAEASLGERSMYISSDGGNSATYTREVNNASRIVIAWRELQLEAGKYDIAFDWMCAGDTTRAALYMAWVPESEFDNIYCALNDNMSALSWYKYCGTFKGFKHMTGASVWSHAVDSIESDGTPHRLVYAFVISGTASLINPGGAVDNIQIARNNCGRPSSLATITVGQIVTLSWKAQGDKFNLKLHRMGDNVATVYNGLTGSLYTTMLPYGVYDIQMQVICNGDTSVWYDFPVVFIFDARCFNYLNLTDERCSFSYNTASDYKQNNNLTYGKIDLGFTSMYSRHTIHYHPNEYDARTYNSVDDRGNKVPPLKTVPKDELASVRIGSWEKTARAARIEYEFTVDADDADVLMLKYAMVLESSGHDEYARPRLMIDVVDAITGESISECTTIDLAAQTSGEGWYRVPDGGTGDRDVCWRDWTTLGINLGEQYNGRQLKVVLTALGCTASIHYGYAYFTLNCISGRLQGIQCGDTPTNEFIAPAGFNYRWHKAYTEQNKIISNKDTFPVDYRDTTTYVVEVINKSKSQCSFTLTANATPRFPIPDATYQIIQRDCKNYIRFINNSHIRTKIWTTGEEIDTPFRPEAIKWDFNGMMPDSLAADGMPWEPEFEMPAEGGDYQFTLQATVGLCDSVQTINVHVPVAAPDSVVERIQKCYGDIFTHKGKYYISDTTLIDRDFNQAGCDSVHTYVLRFVEVIRDTLDIVITEGQSYEVGGKLFDTTGSYDVTMPSAMGCDSVVTLNLRVVEPLTMSVVDAEAPCPEDKSFIVAFAVQKGEPNHYDLTFDDNALVTGFVNQSGSFDMAVSNTIDIPVPANVRPDFYLLTFVFDSEENGRDTLQTEIQVRYSKTIIEQRWDDVLGLLNEDYNGGYVFSSYQWYKNGVAEDGAIYPYYYVGDGKKLSAADVYAALLVREGEQRGILTCDFTPNIPASTQPQAHGKMLKEGRLYIVHNGVVYNTQGMVVGAADNEEK